MMTRFYQTVVQKTPGAVKILRKFEGSLQYKQSRATRLIILWYHPQRNSFL